MHGYRLQCQVLMHHHVIIHNVNRFCETEGSCFVCGECSLFELLNMFNSIGWVLCASCMRESVHAYSIALLWSQLLLENGKAQMTFLNQRPTGVVNRLNTLC